MALRAGYYGLKGRLSRNLQDEFEQLDGIIPAGASAENPLVVESEVKFEHTYITKAETITTQNNSVLRFGREVHIWVQLSTPDASAANVVVGTCPFKPYDDFAFVDVFEATKPYANLGQAFIRKTNGNIEIPQGLTTQDTHIYLRGSFIKGDDTANRSKEVDLSDPGEEMVPKKKTTKKSTVKEGE